MVDRFVSILALDDAAAKNPPPSPGAIVATPAQFQAAWALLGVDLTQAEVARVYRRFGHAGESDSEGPWCHGGATPVRHASGDADAAADGGGRRRGGWDGW